MNTNSITKTLLNVTITLFIANLFMGNNAYAYCNYDCEAKASLLRAFGVIADGQRSTLDGDADALFNCIEQQDAQAAAACEDELGEGFISSAAWGVSLYALAVATGPVGIAVAGTAAIATGFAYFYDINDTAVCLPDFSACDAMRSAMNTQMGNVNTTLNGMASYQQTLQNAIDLCSIH